MEIILYSFVPDRQKFLFFKRKCLFMLGWIDTVKFQVVDENVGFKCQPWGTLLCKTVIMYEFHCATFCFILLSEFITSDDNPVCNLVVILAYSLAE